VGFRYVERIYGEGLARVEDYQAGLKVELADWAADISLGVYDDDRRVSLEVAREHVQKQVRFSASLSANNPLCGEARFGVHISNPAAATSLPRPLGLYVCGPRRRAFPAHAAHARLHAQPYLLLVGLHAVLVHDDVRLRPAGVHARAAGARFPSQPSLPP